jgi:hypothetical protein
MIAIVLLVLVSFVLLGAAGSALDGDGKSGGAWEALLFLLLLLGIVASKSPKKRDEDEDF